MKQRMHGFTLVEILIVVSILGIIAVVVIPDLAATRNIQLEVAANEIADAIEFARDESVRSGTAHGVEISASQKRIRVFSADTSITPPALLYDVYHPLSKQLYDIDLAQHSFTSINAVSQTVTTNGSCSTPGIIIFNPQGSAFCGNPYSSIFLQNNFILTLDRSTITVSLLGITGRVIVQ